MSKSFVSKSLMLLIFALFSAKGITQNNGSQILVIHFNQQENSGLRKFKADLLRLIPLSIQNALSDRPLLIQLMPWEPQTIPPLCLTPSTNSATTEEIRIKLGSTTRNVFQRKSSPRSIQLHQGFLKHIHANSNLNKIDFPCGHKSYYRWALATVLHEIVHLYDIENLPARNNPIERAQRAQCKREQIQKRRGQPNTLSPHCRLLFSQQFSISDRTEFLNLASFKQGFINQKPLNNLHNTSSKNRSPDIYEYTNPQESLAVNMEYFLLDPEYSCRRPQMARFLSKAFNHKARTSVDCAKFKTVRVSSSHENVNEWQNLDPARVYQIHYLLAGPGEKAMSRFGHSMYRIVMCAPAREKVSEDCLNDVSHHIVVSFRADISTLEINGLDGFLGKYPSMLFLLRLPEVINEYNYGEDRDLFSIPLTLKEDEKNSFIERVVESFWEYRGRYYFLTNNCASESAKFLWGALGHSRTNLRTTTPVVSPQGLGRMLAKHQLIDQEWNLEKLRTSSTRSVTFFPAAFRHGEIAIQKLHDLKAIPSNLDSKTYLDILSSDQRLDLYNNSKHLFANQPKELRQLTLNFYALENIRRQRVMALLKTEIIDFFESIKNNKELEMEVMEIANEGFKIKEELLPWNIAKKGYGIPSPNEMQSKEDLSTKEARMFELQKLVVAQLKDLPFQSILELNAVRLNLQFLMEELRKVPRS